MKRILSLSGASVAALSLLAACSGSPAASAPAGEDPAILVAALSANDDGSGETWPDAPGTRPLVVGGCGFGQIVRQIVQRFDADGSGELDETERAALVSEFGDPTRLFALLTSVYDTDASGVLEDGELAALQADLEARCESRRAALLAEFDANGDGRLDEVERQAVEAALGARFGRRGGAGAGFRGRGGRRPGGGHALGGGGLPAYEAELDADGDGELDGDERGRARSCMRGERPRPGVDDPANPPPAPPDDVEPPAPAADAGVPVADIQ